MRAFQLFVAALAVMAILIGVPATLAATLDDDEAALCDAEGGCAVFTQKKLRSMLDAAYQAGAASVPSCPRTDL